jgi:hypothetical protein
MKRIIRLLLAVSVLLTVVSLVLGGSYAYLYKINNFDYSVEGVTSQPGAQIIYAATNGYAQSGSPSVIFQQLNLETRVWRNAGTSCALGQKLYQEKNSKVYNTNSTAHNVGGPSSGFWYAVSKHKLVDTRATNSAGNTPSAFYSEVPQLSPPPTQTRYRGSGVGC